MQELFSGWFLVNIVAPLLLPVFGLLVLRLLPLPVNPPSLRILTTVKDGQLCWAVIAMGSATMYELREYIQKGAKVEAWQGGVFVGMILVMLPAMMIAAGGAVFTTPLLLPSSSGAAVTARLWLGHYRVFVWSLIMTLIASAVYTFIHFTISP